MKDYNPINGDGKAEYEIVFVRENLDFIFKIFIRNLNKELVVRRRVWERILY